LGGGAVRTPLGFCFCFVLLVIAARLPTPVRLFLTKNQPLRNKCFQNSRAKP
jgi:hypothetical protein